MTDIAHLFNRNVQFNGTLLYGDGQEMEGNCRAVFNPIDPSENEVRFRRSLSSAAVEEFKRGGNLMQGSVEIEGESGDRQYVFEGRVVNSDINAQSADYRLRPNDLNEVLVTAGTDKTEGLQQTTKFFLPPFDELYRAFARTSFRHYQHGYVCGWIPESLNEIENGRWDSSSKKIEIGGHHVEIGNAFKFEEAVANFSESTIVAPTIRIKREVPEPSLPETVRDVRQMTERVYEELMPLWSALRFALGRRADPPYQELTTHDYENGAILKGRRFWNRSNEVESRPGRVTDADQLWNLVEELARRFDSLEGDELQRAEKAVNRYVEAFEAPHLELKLTLLHSGIHLIVTKDEYREEPDDVAPEEVPKPHGGPVNWGVAKFIGVHGIEWRDLFSDEVDREEMYAFNRLRNDYLKRDKRGFLESTKPVWIAQRLFERIFLADLGIDPSDHPVLGGYQRG
jgi:hypothetical protein